MYIRRSYQPEGSYTLPPDTFVTRDSALKEPVRRLHVAIAGLWRAATQDCAQPLSAITFIDTRAQELFPIFRAEKTEVKGSLEIAQVDEGVLYVNARLPKALPETIRFAPGTIPFNTLDGFMAVSPDTGLLEGRPIMHRYLYRPVNTDGWVNAAPSVSLRSVPSYLGELSTSIAAISNNVASLKNTGSLHVEFATD